MVSQKVDLDTVSRLADSIAFWTYKLIASLQVLLDKVPTRLGLVGNVTEAKPALIGTVAKPLHILPNLIIATTTYKQKRQTPSECCVHRLYRMFDYMIKKRKADMKCGYLLKRN